MTPDQWREKTICSFFPDILPNVRKDYPTIDALKKTLMESGFRNIKAYPYRIMRYTSPVEFIEAAEKGLWSMFKYVKEKDLKDGIERLRGLDGQFISNDELITLVVAR